MEDNLYKEDMEFLAENVQKLNQLCNIQETNVKSTSVLKRLIRKLTYWLYKPMFEQQQEFNMRIAAAISDIYRISSNGTEHSDYMKFSDNVLPETEKPRIIQLVSSLNYGDAVGNEVVAYKKLFQEAGYVTQIFAETIHKKIPAGVAYPIRFLPELSEKDIIIYHFSSQCGLFEYVKKTKAQVILRYHNITPPEFFRGYDDNAEKATKTGLKQVAELKDYVDFCIPVSEFNKQDLIKLGYKCEMQVVPILIRFEDYESKPSEEIVQKYCDGRTNVLFVGRMAPNKKVEDVISSFQYYKEKYDAEARLFLVGSYGEKDKYYEMLKKHIVKLGVKDVIFSGHISFADILAYYKIANVFVCMSEHEGFCVPLVEAMYFGVPIVAYDSCAVPETMGEKLSTIKQKTPNEVAQMMDFVINDEKIRAEILNEQNLRLHYYDNEKVQRKLFEALKLFVQMK